MRVLVAGGAGFIGSHVCEALLAGGHEVVCLDNLVTGRLENLAAVESHPRFALLRSDVTRAPLLDVGLILHLASPASPVQYQRYPIETMLANSAGTHRLLAIAADTGARFVFASTSEVYGEPLEHPQREEYRGNVSPHGPRACYDEAKRFGEAITFAYRRTRGVNATIVRIFNTYGPRMDPQDGRVVPAFMVAALAGRPLPIAGSGRQTRSFCYVDDLVRGLLLVALDRAADGEVLNIGNDREVTVLELAREVARQAGHAGALAFGPAAADDPSRRCPDLARMRARYGWAPAVPLPEGLRRTLASLRQEIDERVAA